MKVDFDTSKVPEWQWRRRARAAEKRVAELEADVEYANRIIASLMARQRGDVS